MSASCQAKERHVNDLAAQAAALRALDRQQGNIRVLYAYHCPKCDGWHVARRWREGAVEFRNAKEAA